VIEQLAHRDGVRVRRRDGNAANVAIDRRIEHHRTTIDQLHHRRRREDFRNGSDSPDRCFRNDAALLGNIGEPVTAGHQRTTILDEDETGARDPVTGQSRGHERVHQCQQLDRID
jgi:hypothetical protein